MTPSPIRQRSVDSRLPAPPVVVRPVLAIIVRPQESRATLFASLARHRLRWAWQAVWSLVRASSRSPSLERADPFRPGY